MGTRLIFQCAHLEQKLLIRNGQTRMYIDVALFRLFCEGEGEGEDAVFSAKLWDRRNRAELIESANPYYDVQVVGTYRVSNPLRQTALTAPQNLQNKFSRMSKKSIPRFCPVGLDKIEPLCVIQPSNATIIGVTGILR